MMFYYVFENKNAKMYHFATTEHSVTVKLKGPISRKKIFTCLYYWLRDTLWNDLNIIWYYL